MFGNNGIVSLIVVGRFVCFCCCCGNFVTLTVFEIACLCQIGRHLSQKPVRCVSNNSAEMTNTHNVWEANALICSMCGCAATRKMEYKEKSSATSIVMRWCILGEPCFVPTAVRHVSEREIHEVAHTHTHTHTN